jgi:hypothetical protein
VICEAVSRSISCAPRHIPRSRIADFTPPTMMPPSFGPLIAAMPPRGPLLRLLYVPGPSPGGAETCFRKLTQLPSAFAAGSIAIERRSKPAKRREKRE